MKFIFHKFENVNTKNIILCMKYNLEFFKTYFNLNKKVFYIFFVIYYFFNIFILISKLNLK